MRQKLLLGVLAFFAVCCVSTSPAYAAADITITDATTTSATTILVELGNLGGHGLNTATASKWHIDQNGGGTSPLTASSIATTAPNKVTLTFTGSPFSDTSTSYTAALGLYVDASGIADYNGDTNAVVADSASKIIRDGQAPTITSVTPASSAYFNNISTASDVAFTFSEAVASSTILFIRTSGTADSSSPHVCLVSGTGLNTGAHSAFDMSNTTNGCSVATMLTEGTLYTMTVLARDSSGNEATAVSDTSLTYDATAPTVTITGTNPLTHYAGVAYTDAGASASDAIDGDLTSSISTTNGVSTTLPGAYTVVYSVTDTAGNTGTATRDVNVYVMSSGGGGGVSYSGGSMMVPVSTQPTPVSIAPSAQTAVVTTPVVVSSPSYGIAGASTLTRQLVVGASNSDVTLVQKLLSQDKDIYPAGLVTGYFGNMTKSAVQKFQVKYNVAGPGVVGYGQVGPKTRAKLMEVYGK